MAATRTMAALQSVLLPSAAATRALGRALGHAAEAGDLIGLDGPLGAGKTCLVQGLARGLGVPEERAVGSPTFTLLNEHHGRLVLRHADLYRLAEERELAELGLWEAAEAGGVLVVEWLGRFPRALPADRLQIDLSLPPGGGRAALLSAGGPRSAALLRRISPWIQQRGSRS